MSFSTAFRGGSVHVGYSPFTDYDNIFIYDSISYPTGNPARDGGAPISIDGIVVVNGSGITAQTVSSDGLVRVYNGTARLNASRNPGAGGNIMISNGVVFGAGGLVGYFTWSTVATIPGSCSGARTGRNILVTATGSGSDGGSGITSYKVQRAWSLNGTSGWSAWESEQTLSSFQYNYTNLTPGRYWKFRVYAVNANGLSAARESSAIFVPAGGKRKVSGSFQFMTIAKRRASGVWTDLTIAKRRASGSFVDLS